MAEADQNLQTTTTDVENIDFILDELGDIENDLPKVETLQSLESILNEPDVDDVFNDESLQFLQDDSVDTTSMASHDSLDEKKKRSRKSVTYDEHGSILRSVALKQISGQLMSASDRVDAGLPTAMGVSSLIAIGTSHGLVLVFDPKQVLKWCLGSTAVGAQYGAVSALGFNRDCTRLLCGFAKGQITMWDLTNGKLLRTISDAHPPGTAVLHVKFTDELTIAVCSDSGGSVFELEMKRLIGVRTCESKCLFSGSRGEVCAVEPLHMNYTIKDHPMKDVMILAMASLSKVLIVTLRPQLKVMFTHPLKGDPATLPLLAWQFVIIQVSAVDRVIDPVLAFGRESTIYFYQVICNGPEDMKFSKLQVMELPYKLLTITWINTRTLVTLDMQERIHVIDVRSEAELEVIDISELQLVYGTSHFKSLATGGNVSQALAYAGDHACYQSVVGANGQILVMGTRTVQVFTMRTWQERMDVLIKKNDYQEALSLGLSFYDNKAKAVVGLLGGAQKRRETVANKMLEILYNYVDLSMTKLCPESGRIEVLEEHYQSVVPICVDNCLHLQRIDVLFGRIYERFSKDIIARGTFLECLEPYILDDKLRSITPAVMKDFVEHYTSKGWLQNVETCVVHLDVASLDIHQIVVLCWQNGLYDAILYVYNKGMNDYTSPLEELLTVLQMAMRSGKQLTDDQIKLGNKILVYISCCLAGRAYPLGDIADELVSSVKENVFLCVTCLHTKDADSSEPAFPHLQTLLKYDTREFLNVLALAFEEPEFNTPEGVLKRQRVVDILLQVMVENVGFSPSQVGILFTFLARQMARHENTIVVNRHLFEQVLEFLSQPGDDTRHEERQQALLELLQAGGLQQFDEMRLLNLAENAKFYRVCELLYEKRREFNKILSCYWRDESRKHQAFAYIQGILLSKDFSPEEKRNVQDEALLHLEELVAINQKNTAQLIVHGFPDRLDDIIKNLEKTPETLFRFLKGLFEYRETTGSAIYPDKQGCMDPSVHERYIELMCEYQPTMVYHYIIRTEGYRLEQTLEICRRHKILDAMAFLLEKTGDVLGAFTILLENMKAKVNDVMTMLQATMNGGSDRDISLAVDTMKATLLVVIQLCQRSSAKMNENDREAVWFPLLESMMMPQRKLKNLDKQYSEMFKEQTRHVLNSMMGYIGPPAILQKIMQDPSYSTGKFGEIKELILGMLDTCNYEKTLRNTCINLLNYDLHMQLSGLQKAARKGYITREEECSLCKRTFDTTTDGDTAIVFRCGHGYHSTCLQSRGGCRVVDKTEEWTCYLCTNAEHGRQSTRFQRQPSNPGTSKGGQSGTKDGAKEVTLSSQQLIAIENLRRSQKTQSRIMVLNELSRPSHPSSRQSASALHHEQFRLRLAPPPLEASQ